MMPKSKLVRRFFSVIVLIILFFSSAVYVYSVPFIKDHIFDIERNASRIVLNNVFELASKIHLNMESYRREALDARKRQLQTVLSLAESYVRSVYSQVETGFLTEEQARARVFEGLRYFTYGKNDYFWIADYNAVLLSHPDPRFHGSDASDIVDDEGKVIIPRVVALAQAEGEGFYSYKWRRLGTVDEIDKLSYVRNYPQWGFVIGSGIYLDDIDEEMRLRKQQAIADLRDALSPIRIAKTGYLYIFDSKGIMLAHPNPNIDGTNFSQLLDPVTQRPIAQELIEVADTGRELYYKWDKPSDPDNYAYEKLSLVRHFEGFDWYIGSSVYVDELRRSAEVISERIMVIAGFALLVAIVLAFFFVERVASPIKRLADTAIRVREGDLTAQSGIVRDDELGVLARTFDDMVQRLSGNIQNLDQKVKERTAALESTNTRLLDAIDSQRKAQQDLAVIEERQRLILDALPAQIAYVGTDLRYHFVNRGYAEMFSRDKASVVGQHLETVMGKGMLNDIIGQIRRTLQGEETVFEYQFDLPQGEIITKRMLIPDIAADGSVQGILNLSLDITAEKDAEHKLTEAQRISAVGQLAGGLAHDFNNLLTIILGNLIAAQEHFSQHEGLDDYLRPAIRASQRGADITNRLLAFSRRQPLMPGAVNVDHLIRDGIVLLEGSLPSNIAIQCGFNGEGHWAFADASQLESALFNLALNARDAMPKGGTLRFDVRAVTVSEPLEYDEAVEPGDYIDVSVSDTGEGFSEQGLQKAFEPFFTTKSVGAGSGLGLSMVYGFVKQSSGYIRLDTTPGEGSTVSLLLPALPAGCRQISSPLDAESGSVPENFERKLMLLVEDDADVRSVIRGQLVALGFAVIEASCAAEALPLIESLDGLFGMVSDVIMPGETDGFELARTLQQRIPTARIVLISGYSFDHDKLDEAGRPFTLLRKPFVIGKLRDALQVAKRSAMKGSSAKP